MLESQWEARKCVMLCSVGRELASPHLVARFQRWCGVEQVGLEKEATTNGCRDRSPVEDSNHTATRPSPPRPDHLKHRHCAPPSADSLGHNNNSPYLHAVANGAPVNGYVNGVANGYTYDKDLLIHAGHGESISNGVSPSHLQSPGQGGKCLSNGTSTPSECPTGSCPLQTLRGVPGDKADCDGHAAGWDEQSEGQGEGDRCGSATRLVIRYPVLYYWARLGATLGNEEFYLTVMPFLLWTVDAAMIRQTAILWWLVMYVGQASKDYLGWPRPPSPPVLRLETTHLAEFSMPSTHAMAGTAIPLLLAKLILQRYEMPLAAVVSVACLWCATTCLSRLYLGVHTVLDVVCGVLLALALFLLVSPLIPFLDYYLQTHPLAPLSLLVTALALCTVCYPSNSKNSAKGDAIIITAVIVGLYFGAWLNYHLEVSLETPRRLPMAVSAPTLSWVGRSLLQFVVGVAVVFALKAVLKPVTVRLFCGLYGLREVDPQHPGVLVGYRYSTYLCLGLAISFLDPWLFTALGFGRPGYYGEVV